ncbi:MAG: type transport system ATP-binding protein [Candidatus Sumerlaeota bacterium]|nr:type transport system ATP-binding protein [Candidatus Sumerlaeota bacterium]
MIQISNVTKVYKDLTAVNGLSMEINQGDIFGFIGPNGAGKTTTIKILATLLKPTQGYALVCGYNVLTQADDVKRVMGYMPDSFGVYDDMKVWEYLDFFAAAYKIEKARRKQIIDDVLELTDLTHKKNDYVEALSRGMKQRLCLAKTLVHDPQVLLLDEPASGLDPRARIELRELLKELRNMGKTILISSHILTELADFCNSVGIIEQGNLLYAGDIQTITEQLRGARVVEIMVKEGFEQKAEDIFINCKEVREVEREGRIVRVHLPLDFENDDFVTDTLVENAIKFSSVKELEVDLEDVFMKVTKGLVQ